MIKIFKNINYILLIYLIISCNSEIKKDYVNLDEIFAKINRINTDSLRHIDASWREHNLLMVRIDSIEDGSKTDILFLIKENDRNEIQCKLGAKWMQLDSLSKYFTFHEYEFIKSKLVYTYSFMKNNEVSKIQNNNGVLIIKVKGIIFYYVYVPSEFKKSPYYQKPIHLKNNWWYKVG